MAIHDHFHRRQQRAAAVEARQVSQRDLSTVYEIVYTTAPQTFSGDIAGYTTLGNGGILADPSPSPAAPATSTPAAVAPAATTPAAAPAGASASPAKSSSAVKPAGTTSLPSSIVAPSTTLGSSVPLVAATAPLSLSAATSSGAHAASTVSASDASSSSSSSADSTSGSNSMSLAGTAGLVVGILLLIGAVLALVLLCFKKRRGAAKKPAENEKHEFTTMDRHFSTGTTATTATAPRLSLRPVTQFLPNLSVKRASRGNALLTVTEDGKVWDVGHQAAIERPNTANSQSNHQENPFGNHAESIQPVAAEPLTSPFDEPNEKRPEVFQGLSSNGLAVPGAAVAVASAAAVEEAAPGLKRGISKRGNGPSPLDFTKSGPFMGPPSPAGTEFSMTSDSGSAGTPTGTAAAIAAAGGPVNSAVHRVQLDFKPSMDDELELRAGQLIRMLHEYDDGWALCIRLDRSRQGVVPRTCLSTRPVKPRPQHNGPRIASPAMRSPPPGQNVPRPLSPNSQRPMTPEGPLPLTPFGASRSSPRAQNQNQSQNQSPPRSNSPQQTTSGYTDASGTVYPYPQAPLGRKPVPGQAL